eukprot:jgi/Ulvmu1/8642/UM046_0047.1
MNALPPDVTFVSTPQELRTAVTDGARDIVILSHLDLTGLKAVNSTQCADCIGILGDVHPWTRSIRGNCADEPPSAVALQLSGSGLAPRRGNQCVLTTPLDTIHVGSGNVWLDSLYLRLRATGVTAGYPPTLISANAAGRLWMTNVTMQGDADSVCQGLSCSYAVGALLQDCEFRNLGGSSSAAHSTDTPLSLIDTDFVENEVPYDDYGLISAWNEDAVITLEGCRFDGNIGPNLFYIYSGASVYASGTTGVTRPLLASNYDEEKNVTVPPVARAPASPVRLQPEDPWFRGAQKALAGTNIQAPLAAAPAVAVAADVAAPLSATPRSSPAPDPLVAVAPASPIDEPPTTRAALPPGAYAPQGALSSTPAATDSGVSTARAVTPDNSSSSSDGTSPVVIAAAAFAALVLLAVIVIACLCRCRRRRGKGLAAAPMHAGVGPYWGTAHSSGHSAYAGGHVPAGSSGYGTSKSAGALPYMHAIGAYEASRAAQLDEVILPRTASLAAAAADGTVSTSAGGTEDRTAASNGIMAAAGGSGGGSGGSIVRGETVGTVWNNTTFGMHAEDEEMQPPPAGASVQQRVAWAHHQLDSFKSEDVVLGRFRLLGPESRRQGGQGVVQFAVGHRDGHAYALKFFVVRASFDAERTLYADPALAPFLPRLEALEPNEGGALVDNRGHALPPCIAMEKGESLDEWSRRAKPDLFMAVTVLANVAARLRDMHAAGYAHRDLKPPNVMWLPRENRWTVIDFGCAARIGETAPLSFTLAYAAPEVIAAMHAGERTIAATGALDVWAVGVMAFEMLTGATAFAMPFVSKDDVIAQLLGKQALPWEEGQLSAAQRSRLGVFRRPVLQLLERDPVRRPSLQQFCDMCTSIFSATTTVNL